MEKCSTSGKMDDEICLMGLDYEDVSNSKSKNCDFTFDELFDAFHDLHDEFEKMISKNKALKNQIIFLSKQNEDLNNQTSLKNDCKNCVDFQEENNFFKDRVERLDYENEVLKETILNMEKENKVFKEKYSCFEKEKDVFKNQVLKRK